MGTITVLLRGGRRCTAETGELAQEFWDWAGDGRYALGADPFRLLPQLDVAVGAFLDFHLRARLHPRDALALQRSVAESGPTAPGPSE
jgi:hypothetical protein